jgi:RNA polymerase sigma-70 factor (ECF subfamily)
MGIGDQEPLDRAAFEQVVAEYADRLYGVAVRITGSSPDAEDAVQEAFLNAFRNLRQFRGAANPHTWLYRITVNAALQRVRERRPQEYLDDSAPVAAPAASWNSVGDDAAVTTELREHVELALSRLPPDYRTAVILRDVEGLSAVEAAQVLEIGEAALKSRLHRGRVMLRQLLDEYLQG